MDKEAWNAFLNAKIKLWFCPNQTRETRHEYTITWEGQQARCKCGATRLPEGMS